MAYVGLFVVLAIIVLLMILLVAGVCTLAAINAFNSPLFVSQSKMRTAYSLLAVAAAIAWTILLVLLILFIIAAVAGGLGGVDISDAFYTMTTYTASDIALGQQAVVVLTSGSTVAAIVITILVIITISILVAAILATVAVANISSVRGTDSKAGAAFTEGIIGLIAGYGAFLFLIFTTLAYVAVRYSRFAQADRLSKILAAQAVGQTVVVTQGAPVLVTQPQQIITQPPVLVTQPQQIVTYQ